MRDPPLGLHFPQTILWKDTAGTSLPTNYLMKGYRWDFTTHKLSYEKTLINWSSFCLLETHPDIAQVVFYDMDHSKQIL